MDLKELKELLSVLRSNGVTSYQSSDLKLELIPEPSIPQEANPSNYIPSPTYTDEQMMLWSAPNEEATE